MIWREANGTRVLEGKHLGGGLGRDRVRNIELPGWDLDFDGLCIAPRKFHGRDSPLVARELDVERVVGIPAIYARSPVVVVLWNIVAALDRVGGRGLVFSDRVAGLDFTWKLT